jgi:hypothetical protein
MQYYLYFIKKAVLKCLSNDWLPSTDCYYIFRLINHNKKKTGFLMCVHHIFLGCVVNNNAVGRIVRGHDGFGGHFAGVARTSSVCSMITNTVIYFLVMDKCIGAKCISAKRIWIKRVGYNIYCLKKLIVY